MLYGGDNAGLVYGCPTSIYGDIFWKVENHMNKKKEEHERETLTP